MHFIFEALRLVKVLKIVNISFVYGGLGGKVRICTTYTLIAISVFRFVSTARHLGSTITTKGRDY